MMVLSLEAVKIMSGFSAVQTKSQAIGLAQGRNSLTGSSNGSDPSAVAGEFAFEDKRLEKELSMHARCEDARGQTSDICNQAVISELQ